MYTFNTLQPATTTVQINCFTHRCLVHTSSCFSHTWTCFPLSCNISYKLYQAVSKNTENGFLSSEDFWHSSAKWGGRHLHSRGKNVYHSQIPAPLPIPNPSTTSHPNTLSVSMDFWIEWPKDFFYLLCKSSCICCETSEPYMKKYNQGYSWVGLDTTISKQKANASVPSRQHDTCKVNQVRGYSW